MQRIGTNMKGFSGQNKLALWNAAFGGPLAEDSTGQAYFLPRKPSTLAFEAILLRDLCTSSDPERSKGERV